VAIVTAKLVKLVTDDKLAEVNPDVPLGKVYRVDINTRRRALMFNIMHRVEHEKEIVYAYPPGNGWLICELLEFGGAPE